MIFGQVTAIVQQAQKQSEKYHSFLDNIRSFQKLYRVPDKLSARILDYFMSTWALTKGVDTDEVSLNDLNTFVWNSLPYIRILTLSVYSSHFRYWNNALKICNPTFAFIWIGRCCTTIQRSGRCLWVSCALSQWISAYVTWHQGIAWYTKEKVWMFCILLAMVRLKWNRVTMSLDCLVGTFNTFNWLYLYRLFDTVKIRC